MIRCRKLFKHTIIMHMENIFFLYNTLFIYPGLSNVLHILRTLLMIFTKYIDIHYDNNIEYTNKTCVYNQNLFNTVCYLAPGGGCEVLFSPGLSVCLCVCLSVCVCVCPANILVFYFSAIRRDIDLKFMQDIYRVVLNSLKKH